MTGQSMSYFVSLPVYPLNRHVREVIQISSRASSNVTPHRAWQDLLLNRFGNDFGIGFDNHMVKLLITNPIYSFTDAYRLGQRCIFPTLENLSHRSDAAAVITPKNHSESPMAATMKVSVNIKFKTLNLN
ncbi:hypothetical protein QL285_077934 [Trifolium repens]|nr:hypothetical protein QL285_077934 [Trifolium repens]